MHRPSVQLLVPVYNEGSAVAGHLQHILLAASAIESTCALSLLIIDDGSTDQTAKALQDYCATEPRARWLGFTRNFGKEAAIQAALDASDADAVILLDSDLQHPPELIPQMVTLWQAGALVVEAHKSDRRADPLHSRILAGAFYRIFRTMAGLDLRGQSDFKLLDHTVVQQLRQLPERERFFRGLTQWLHYPSARVHFNVPSRAAGHSRWSLLQLLRYALRNITAFSALPLQLVTWVGLLSLAVGIVFSGIALLQKWQGQALDGFTTVILLQIFFSGTLMLSIGLIGHYLARIHQEIKGRPHYVLRPPPAQPPQ